MEKDGISDFKVVLIGGSAGSLEVLLKVVPQLDAVPAAALVLVVHRMGGDNSKLEELFAVKSRIATRPIEDKTRLKPGTLYIAPADYHLLFENDGRLSLDISEKVNYSRPSIDVAFESAAEVYGNRLAGILLSGSNADGTAGLQAVQSMGGTVVVQDPESAEMPFMPRSAIDALTPDSIVDARGLLDFIRALQ